MTIAYKPTTEYGLFKNGVCEFKGNAHQCSAYVGLSDRRGIISYYTQGVRCRGYDIQKTGMTVTEFVYPEKRKSRLTPKIEKPKKKTEQELLTESLIFHLNTYGSTVLNEKRDIEFYIKELEKYGLKCSYRVAYMIESPDGVRNPKIRGEQGSCYILEVKK